MAKITYTRGDGKGGTVTKTGYTSSSSAKKTKSSGGSSSSSKQIGLNEAQMAQLANADWVNKDALQAYRDSGSVVGGSNNPNGRGREAITPDRLEKTEALTLPVKTTPVTPGLDLTMNNTALGAGADGMFQIPPIASQAGDTEGVTAAKDASNTIAQYMEQAMGLARPQDGANEKALADARRQAGVDAAQQEFNRYSNQINAITAKRDAAQLGLEGQGRGITDTIIGGQQARIGREAAIQALPIQAQLAAAQGNLEQAKALMGQLFTAKSADIQADQTYRTSLANSVMSWATTSQQAILQAKQADIAQRAQTAQANLAYQRQLGLQALEYGQNNLITGIAGVDPNSPTFEAEMAAYTAQLRKPVAPTKLDTSFDKFGNLINMQTGEVVRYADDVAPGDGGYTPEQIVQQKADSLATQIKTIEGLKTHPGMKATVGAYGISRWTPFKVDKSEQKDFIAGVEQLISQKFLDSLIDTKAKGGSFGALTKPEQDALTVAATKIGNWRIRDGDGENAKVIGYEIGEADMQTELDTLITLAQKAESMARGYDVTLVGQDDSETIDNIFKAYQQQTFEPANYFK